MLLDKSPFNSSNQNFKKDPCAEYYAVTITLPARKFFHGKMYSAHDPYSQKLILTDILFECFGLLATGGYYSFEEHPNRNGGLHLHAIIWIHNIFEDEEYFREYDFLRKVKHYTCIRITKSICKIERMYHKKDMRNWINYIFKENATHWYLTNERDNNYMAYFCRGRPIVYGLLRKDDDDFENDYHECEP